MQASDPSVSFETHTRATALELEGTVAEVQHRWHALTRPLAGIGLLSRIAMAFGRFAGLREPEVELDSRKLGLIDALLVYLEREVDPRARVGLDVDFRSPRMLGIGSSDPIFDWSGLALPDSEPTPHDWMRLQVQVGELALSMWTRTLLGTMGDEIRLRDELAIELRGEGLATALCSTSPATLMTKLLAHDLEPTRARLHFRGGCAARRIPVSDEDEPNDFWYAMEAMSKHRRPLLPEPREYRYEDIEWLLTGNAIVDHIEVARALVRP